MPIDRVMLLDENTANRIAAGEVIERPASAVKELVENAIDAGATHITVSLEEGGKQRITVADDGEGMARSDAILALQRHATSKIRTADDLFAVRTLGFRGEALPSIASVSRFELVTKPRDADQGIRLLVDGGDLVTVEEAAALDGTTIVVGDLFFNTPARLKFLKSTPAEVGRVMEIVGNLAIGFPGVAMRVRQRSHESLATPGTGDLLSALAAIWGREAARKLLPIQLDSPGLCVTGFVATPDISRTGRTHELFFVNQRPIKSRLLAHAVEDAFRSLTPDSRFPIAAIFIAISPELVDVNVHPTKTEVKFTRDGDVHHAVSQAVKRALLDYGIVPSPRLTVPEISFGTPGARPNDGEIVQSVQMSAVMALGFADTRAVADPARPRDVGEALSTGGLGPFATGGAQYVHNPNTAGAADSGPDAGEARSDEALSVPARPRPFAEQLREFRVIGQARNTYIIALTPDGIAVVDQHVAHERVLYERLTEKRYGGRVPVQRLVMPLTVDLGRREALLLAEHCDSFAAAGWDIAPFGGESFVVRAVPALLANKPYERILRDMVEELVSETISRRLLVQRDHVTITNACKMAVKAGDPLTIDEMTGLLEQLAETENPYLCPHGRPIVVKIPFGELDRQFKRA